jgi:hypothetical protein
MREAHRNSTHESRPNRRFLRRVPAMAAAAALIAAAPAYAATQSPPHRHAAVAPATRQSALTLRDTSGGGAPQTIGSKQ